MTELEETPLAGDQLEQWAAIATFIEWVPVSLNVQLQKDSDVTHFEFGLLYALQQADSSTLRLSILAQYSNSSLTRLSRAVTRLEKRGLLMRSPDRSDGRYTLAILTESGNDLVNAAAPGHASLVRKLIFSSLTSAEASEFARLCQQITSGLSVNESWRSR